MTLKAILFDMDGVLVDSMNHHMQSWKQLLETYDISVTERFIYEHEGAMGVDIIQNLFHKTGLSLDGDQILEIYERQNRIFREEYLDQVRLYPETLTLIEGFQQRGLRLGLVTSSRMNLVEQIWEEHQGLNRFDTIVTADDVSRFKPNPDPYLKGLGEIEPGTARLPGGRKCPGRHPVGQGGRTDLLCRRFHLAAPVPPGLRPYISQPKSPGRSFFLVLR